MDSRPEQQPCLSLPAPTVRTLGRVGGSAQLTCSPPHPFADYVYFENSSSNPYLIRRIEELNKVACAHPCRGSSWSPFLGVPAGLAEGGMQWAGRLWVGCP